MHDRIDEDVKDMLSKIEEMADVLRIEMEDQAHRLTKKINMKGGTSHAPSTMSPRNGTNLMDMEGFL